MIVIINEKEIPEKLRDFIGADYYLTYPTQGYTSDVVVINANRGKYVIKRATGTCFRNMLDNEYKVLSSINVQKISSPCIYEKYEDNEYSWLLMEFIKGETLRNAIRESTSSQRHKMLVNYGKMLWQIHSQKIEINNNDDAWIERKLREAQYNLDNYRIEGTVGKLNYLKNNKPSMIKEVFIHGDYTIDNVMFYGGEVSGVIDWGGGTIGDPRYDVALAIRPKDGVFQNSEDVEYFYEGYGGNRITKKEFDYFQSGGLYDFF